MRYIKNLSLDTQKLLKRIYTKSKKHETRQKAHCILLSFEGYNINNLSLIFKVHINTIYNWFNDWEAKKLLSLYHSKGQGRKPKLNEDAVAFISAKQIENPKDIKSILLNLSEEKKINISKSTLKRVLKKKLHLRWKRIKKSLKLKKPKDYEDKKASLRALEALAEKKEIDLYYADGSGFSLTPTVPYAWQPKNTRLEVPCFRGKTLNLFGLLNTENDLRLYEQEKCFNSQNIIDCIDDFSNTITKRTAIVLDNASVHKSKLFKEKLKEWIGKGLEILYLPTYSPQLNKIEHLWHLMKYEWIEFSAYKTFDNLKEYVRKIKENFGNLYTINFA